MTLTAHQQNIVRLIYLSDESDNLILDSCFVVFSY